MFQLLAERAMLSETEAGADSTAAAGELLAPPKTWVPPLGASARTWQNILKNKNNIDYCTSQFHYLSTRWDAAAEFRLQACPCRAIAAASACGVRVRASPCKHLARPRLGAFLSGLVCTPAPRPGRRRLRPHAGRGGLYRLFTRTLR